MLDGMPASYLVAILGLATSVEDAARALAAELATTAYEERMKLAAGVPAVVLASSDESRARALAGQLARAGHAVHVCATSDIVAASAMISMRRFQIAEHGLVAGDARLAWSDVRVLVRAKHRHASETASTRTEKKLSLGRAIATAGLSVRKTVHTDVVTRAEHPEQVLYVFHAGGVPWLLREHGTHYAGLGAGVGPSAAGNFALAVTRLRAGAPHARFDERLVTRMAPPDEIDLLAHLVAAPADAYRG